MKYTLYCEPGFLGRPGIHSLYIGDWIRPAGAVVLCHGNMSESEYDYISRSGVCPLYNDVRVHLTFVYQDAPTNGGTVYRQEKSKGSNVCGFLRKSLYNENVYRGSIVLHGY